MATDTQVVYDTGAVVLQNVARWPAYETKEDLLRDLFAAIGGKRVMLSDIIMRVSNTDTASGFIDDKASRAA